jgi:hypothetical protein
MREADENKGIFCIESLWNPDLRDPTSVRPVLELLNLNAYIPYIYRNCATKQELEYCLKQWKLARYAKYPILYISSHGDKFGIQLQDEFYSLDQMTEILSDACANRIIIVAACSTLDIDIRHLKRFLRNTGALAICGYDADVDWMPSAAFEILLLSEMQANEFSGRGVDAIKRKIAGISKSFPDLLFRMVTTKELV